MERVIDGDMRRPAEGLEWTSDIPMPQGCGVVEPSQYLFGRTLGPKTAATHNLHIEKPLILSGTAARYLSRNVGIANWISEL